MSFKAGSCGAVLILFSVGLPIVAHGAIVYRYDFGTLTGDAGLVAVTDVVRNVGIYSPAWSGVSGIILQLNIVEVVKGSQFSVIYVVDGNSTSNDPSTGSPSIQVGSRYVLFLFATSNSGLCPTYPAVTRCPQSFTLPSKSNEAWGIVGGPQGKFLVTNGLVYGFKTLYPRFYDSMTVDANGVPLDSFTSQVRSRIQNDSLLPILLLAPLLLSIIFLRKRKLQNQKSGKLALTAIFLVAFGGFLYVLVQRTPLSVLSTINFWGGFLPFAGGMTVLLYFAPQPSIGREPSAYSTRYLLVAILVALSPLVLVLAVFSQTGDTMFEKDFYSVAFVDGLLPGELFGAFLGGILNQWVRRPGKQIEVPQSQTWSATSPVMPA